MQQKLPVVHWGHVVQGSRWRVAAQSPPCHPATGEGAELCLPPSPCKHCHHPHESTYKSSLVPRPWWTWGPWGPWLPSGSNWPREASQASLSWGTCWSCFSLAALQREKNKGVDGMCRAAPTQHSASGHCAMCMVATRGSSTIINTFFSFFMLP